MAQHPLVGQGLLFV